MLKLLVKLRVIECSILIGPFAGQLSTDFGAEVIQVKLPGQGNPMHQQASWADMNGSVKSSYDLLSDPLTR